MRKELHIINETETKIQSDVKEALIYYFYNKFKIYAFEDRGNIKVLNKTHFKASFKYQTGIYCTTF